MSIPLRLADYLARCGARYDICTHARSRCSAETARVARVPPHQLAKSVIVEDDEGWVMAVVPADRYVRLGQLSRMLGRERLRLAQESRIASVFADCDRGAVPAAGMAWNIETVVDEELEGCEFVYLEGGDHECLVRMSHDQFRELMRIARHGHFCGAPTH